MATDEILSVDRIVREGSERYARCPHCQKTVGLPDGPVRGEQFQHSNHGGCMGWFEVTHDAAVMLLHA